VERAKIQSESFDDRTVAEVQEFERIKAVEMQDTLGGLADAHINFFKGAVETWEKYLEIVEKEEEERRKAATAATAPTE